ncbi:MAG: hypothetical protein ACOVQS_07775 [Chitinophagaceae bacterium]|jgi:hypothetical protein
MIYTLTFSELAASVFSALMLIASLYSIGGLLHARLKWKDVGADAALITGMAFNHLVFLLLSLCFEGETTVMLMHTLHIIAVAMALMRHPRWFQPTRRVKWQPAVILLVLYLPYLFSPLSPPMNYDAIFAYVHNAEWVFHHGLAFNPSGTAYTTMPMGVEYLFAQAFPIGGKLSIFLLDAFFGILLVRRAYLVAAKHVSPRAALLIVLSLLLIPEGIPYLFGIAKVDSINIYLIISGFAWVLERQRPFRLWFALLAFSMACAVKYTGWLQLGLPIIIIVSMIAQTRGWSKGAFAALLPILFIGPVLVKNLIQTGNPLVGLKWSPSQQVYVEPHAGMTKADPSGKLLLDIGQYSVPIQTTIKVTYNYLNVLFYGILIMLVLTALTLRIRISDQRTILLLLIAALIPWHVFVGDSLQPPRLLLSFYFVILLQCFIIGSRVIRHLGLGTTIILRYAFMTVFTVTFLNTYYRHGKRIQGFLHAQAMPLYQWYEQSGNYVFSITTRLRDEGWLSHRIMFMSPIAKGLLSADQLSGDHTDSSRRAFRSNFSVMRDRYDYVLCSDKDILRYGLVDRPVMIQSGHMYLVKLN